MSKSTFFLVGIISLFILSSASLALSYVNMNPGSSQAGCSCHSDFPDQTSYGLVYNVTPHLDGLQELYQPGETYDLTVWIEGGPEPGGSPYAKGGFALRATAGSLAPVDPALVQVHYNGEATQTAQGAISGRSWQVRWTAPAEGGGVTFYLAVIAVDGDGGRRGDVWDKTEIAIEEIPEFESLLIVPLLVAAFGAVVLLRRTARSRDSLASRK